MSFDTLNVRVIEATGLASMSKKGTSEPYVVIKNSINKQTFKTKAQKKTTEPKWDHSFKLFTSLTEGRLFVKLFHKEGFLKKDMFMGELTISIDKFKDGEEHDEWFNLENEPKDKKADGEPGRLHVKCQFTSPKGSSRRPSNATKEKKEGSGEKSGPARIEDNYKLGKEIGKGAFSVVKEGIRKANGKRYAIKCISKKLIDKKELSLLEREIDIMKKLNHPHIIALMEVVDTPDTLFLVLEYAPGGELFDAIINKGQYSEEDAAKIIKQILEAIKYCHDLGIAHRDLKPENLLLGEGQETVKIADFGLSKDFGQEQLQTSCGTPDYVAPEVLLGEPYDMAVDIWSIGVITYVLLCGFPPFWGETQKELFENIMSGTYDFPEPEWNDVSEEAKEFIRKILVVDPQKRYNAEQCLEDPWMVNNTEQKPKSEVRRLQSFSATKFKEYTAKYKEENKKQYMGNDVDVQQTNK